MLLLIGKKEPSTQMQCTVRYTGSLIRRQKIGLKCLQSCQVPAFPSVALGLGVLSEVLSSAATKLLPQSGAKMGWMEEQKEWHVLPVWMSVE